MTDSKRIDNKHAFTIQAIKHFTDACGGDSKNFTDILYGKYTVECFSYFDDSIYWNVLGYFQKKLIPHKINVYQAGLELSRYEWFKQFEIDNEQFLENLWLHDLSKFSAIEALPYAMHDFTSNKFSEPMRIAWNHHKAHNEHHPEYWLNPNRNGEPDVIKMPDIYIMEMVADWIGAGRTYGNEIDTWLPDNLETFKWHEETANVLKQILEHLDFKISQDGPKLRVNDHE